MTPWVAKDRLHRLEKELMDSGKVESHEAAVELLHSFRMQFLVGPEIGTSPVLQAGLLTAVNTARRSIHGDLSIVGEVRDVPLLVPLPGWESLAEALRGLGAEITRSAASETPGLIFGTCESGSVTPLLQATFDGWSGGVVPAGQSSRLAERGRVTTAGALAGAIGVAELYQGLRGPDARAGYRETGLSLWTPGSPWTAPAAAGPALSSLPSDLWLIGLGHLGQALLWHLALLPYDAPGDVTVVLQDEDCLVKANLSTGVLTTPENLGKRKTRALAAWLDQRGFVSRIVERRFAAGFSLHGDEPRLGFCGVDNQEARREIEDVGFEALVEAGLGTGEEYLAYQLHTFPGPQSAWERWGREPVDDAAPPSRAIERLAEEEGLDDCGLTELAGVKAGASFVGVVASALGLSEMLRPLHGATMDGAVSGTLRSSEAPRVLSGTVGLEPVRYGAVPVGPGVADR